MIFNYIIGLILLLVPCYFYLKIARTKRALVYNCDYDLYFEPKQPITTPEEFVDEIVKHFEEENEHVSILKVGMQPRILLNNIEYECKLGEPSRVWNPIKYPINSFSGRFLGYKWVYIYKVKRKEHLYDY